jgi:LAT3 family solute carrier family 43 protein 3
MASRRWMLYSIAITITSLVAGTVYGWPALRRDLIKEGDMSEKQLGAVFTAGAWSVQGGRFAVGLARDAFGTRYTVCGRGAWKAYSCIRL